METFVAMSGGTDSTALALMMEDATLLFTDTGDEFPELYAHLDKFERVTGRIIERIKTDETLPEYAVRSKYLPGHGSRYCTRMFKIEPMNRYLTDHLPAQLCIGLRADEPADDRVGNLSEIGGLEIHYPFRERGWFRAHCVQKCLEYDLLPRYPVYMARGGCKGCFYKRKSEVLAMAVLVPHVLDELQQREEAIQDERGKFAVMFPNTGSSIAYLRAGVEKQPELFDTSKVWRDAADTSDKGEACGLFCHR